MKKLATWREAVLSTGIRPDDDASERMRIRLANRIALTDAGTGLVVGPAVAALTGDWWWIPLVLGVYAPNVAALWMNRVGLRRLARVHITLASSVVIGAMALLTGPGVHVEMVLVVTLVGALLMQARGDRLRPFVVAAPVVAVGVVLVVRPLLAFDGLAPLAFQPWVFWVTLAVVMSNVAVEVVVLVEAARRRSALLGQATVEAMEASAAKSAFVAHVSHELRTPLSGVIGLTDLLLDGKVSDDQHELLTQSRRSANHLLGLLNGLLDLAKIESGALELEEVDFDLRVCVDDAVSLIEPAAEAKGLTVRRTTSLPEVAWLRGDPLRLRQILVNLMGNAIKFTADGEIELKVLLDQDSGKALFVVRDTGIGMTEEQVETVFQAFKQAESSTARRFGGTGLGLSITKQLVELCGGTIVCRSQPGVGTRFIVGLELAPGSPDVDANADATLQAEGGLQVLVAEDNPVNQLIIRRMLEGMGQEVTLVDNGAKAVQAGRDQRWDLILMDMQMPELDGVSAARALRDEGYDGAIVALTANAMASDAERCLAAGMQEVLVKPVDARTLSSALGRWVRQAA